MIERVLEEEVMVGAEAQAYDLMDHGTANQSFVEDLLADCGDAVMPLGGDEDEDAPAVWLDMGAGNALIPIAFCQRVETARVLASDFSTDMLDMARYHIEVEGLIQRIQLSHDDAKDLPYDDEGFYGVMSNSIVHHIPEPIDALREAVRVTRDGGRLFFRDLARPASEQQLAQLVTTYAGDESEEAQRLFAESLRAALTLEEMQQMVSGLGFSPDSVQMTSDRHWTWSAVKPSAD